VIRSLTLSSAEAPYGSFLGYFFNIQSARGVMGRGKGLLSFPFPAFPARCRFSLSPGLLPRSLYSQSSMKEASAEERGSLKEETRL